MANQRTVTVHHPDKGTIKVTPEVAQALEAGGYGPYSREVDPDSAEAQIQASVDAATAPLVERVAELEAALDYVVAVGAEQDAQLAELTNPAPMPENANERKDWIGNDPARAQQALDDEEARGDKARTTVTDHARSVLNPTPNDQANNGQED